MSWFGKSKEPNAKSPETLEHKRLVLLLSQAEKFKQGGDTFEPEYEWFFAPLPTSAEGQALPLAELRTRVPSELVGMMTAAREKLMERQDAETAETEMRLRKMLEDPVVKEDRVGARLEEIYGYVFERQDTNLALSTLAYLLFVQGDDEAPHEFFPWLMRERGISLDRPDFHADYNQWKAHDTQATELQEVSVDFVQSMTFRNISTFTPEEKVALFIVTALHLADEITDAEQDGYQQLLAWADGKCDWVMREGSKRPQMPVGSIAPANAFLRVKIPNYEGEVRKLIDRGRMLLKSTDSEVVRKWLGKVITDDSRKLDSPKIGGVLRDTATLTDEEFSVSLHVATTGNGSTNYSFLGDESLLTIGAPGSGKSQAQVIPAIMSSTHSMVILDLKGELMKQTAGWLQQIGGRVIRFSLMESDAPAHRYNPMLDLPATTKGLWRKASQMAELLLPDKGHGESNTWVGNARVFLAAHIATVKLELGEQATLNDVMRSMRGGVTIIDGEALRGSPSERLNNMLDVAERHGFDDLYDEVSSLAQLIAGDEGTSSRQYQSIMLDIRPLMNVLMSDEVKDATNGSSWRAEEVRNRPTFIFLQVRDVDIETYKPLLRLMVGQHLLALMSTSGDRPTMPVTFLLDELPQLGNFPEVVRAIEVGRSSRVRIWGFVQDLAQIRSTYPKADVLTNSSAIQTFLSIDMDTAEYLTKLWGSKYDRLTDSRTPAAEPADFFKPDMQGKAIICARGAQPVILALDKAYEIMGSKLNLPYEWTPDGLRAESLGPQ
jgi:type IV secretion system protein VirD4